MFYRCVKFVVFTALYLSMGLYAKEYLISATNNFKEKLFLQISRTIKAMKTELFL